MLLFFSCSEPQQAEEVVNGTEGNAISEAELSDEQQAFGTIFRSTVAMPTWVSLLMQRPTIKYLMQN